MSYRNNTLEGPTTGRSPRVASSLSIFPGLGQIYNSEPRKGVLFMLVGVTNFAVLLFVALSTQFLHLMKAFSQELNLRPNHQLMEALSTVQIGSPVANLLFMLFLCFTVFAMRDAFDRALLLRKQSIYAPSAMHLSEASSGSYLFHIALMFTILILSFFFLIPPAPRQQVTEIEFVQPDEKTHEKVVTRNRSAVRSRAQQDPNVKRTSRDPHAASSQSRAQSATTRRTEAARPQPRTTQRTEAQKPQTQPTPRQAQTTPAQAATRTPPAPAQISHTPPVPRPVPVQRTQNTSAPTPMQAIQPMASRVAPAPQPQAHTPMFPTIPIPNGLLPMPMQAKSNSSAPTLMPQSVKTGGGPRGPMIATAPPSGPINAPRPGIEDVKIGTGRDRGTISPKEIKSDFSGEKDGTGKVPTPLGPKGTKPGKTFESIVPTLPGNVPNSDTNKKNDTPGGNLRNGEPRTASNPVDRGKIGNPNPPGVDKEPDFTAFMADLQRRIKREWFPPSGKESLRVQVTFTAHTNGTMSNLRLKKSAGSSIADQAALKAVQNAAPFRPLPEGAPPSVDIEFTFDYNVFHGGGQGRMRGY